MINKIKQFFDNTILIGSRSDISETDKNEQVMLAGIALLIETAKIDLEIDDDELSQIASIACSLFSVPDSKVQEIVQLARDSSAESTSLYEYTALINEHFDNEQKYQVVLGMWRVAFADGRADHYEEHLIRKVADLIYVPHMKFMEAKHDAKPS